MRVLLVKPPGVSDSVQPPLGLAYLAAHLRKEGHFTRILDCLFEGVSIDDFPLILEGFRPDMVGFQCLTHEVDAVKALARAVKERSSRCVVVAGGPHPTCTQNSGLDDLGPDVDFTIRGEAEFSLPMLADAMEHGGGRLESLRKIPGLSRKSGDTVVNNPVKRYGLSELEMPAWDLVEPECYPPSPNAAFFLKWPVAPIITTRGCDHRCSFCAAPVISGGKVRTRRIDDVMEEIRVLWNRGIREIHVEDDAFTAHRDHALSFCRSVSREFPGLSWACPNGVRTETLDPELLEAMKKSGCHTIAVGIESGSQDVLDRIGKGQTLEQVRNAVDLITSAGIFAVGYFIVGFPGETMEQAEETVRFSLSLPLERANFMLFHPLPGTRAWKEAGRPKRLSQSFAEVAYVPEGWTPAGLKQMQRKAFFKFYSRPSRALGLVRAVRSPSHFFWISKRIARWMLYPGTGQ